MTQILEHNVETGKVVERLATKKEADFIDAKAIEIAAVNAKKEKEEADKAALLTKLGITADEAKLLLQ
jgi:hypothetical protein